MIYEIENLIMPEFPRTAHLPARGGYAPNASSDDRVATKAEASIVLNNPNVWVEEKLDGANAGICLYGENPIIRNRNHILDKGYGRKRTPAKLQFTSIWNWFYENADKFAALNKNLGFTAAVYGEWLFQQHTIFYDKLPELFIPFDIYDSEEAKFLATPTARAALEKAGFKPVPLLQVGVKSYDELIQYFSEPSPWAANAVLQNRAANVLREGVYLKVNDGNRIVARFKMVRRGYKPGEAFTDEIKRNKVFK